ncbi:MAG: sortase domain-containing protein [Thermomicrobiales bacterium]
MNLPVDQPTQVVELPTEPPPTDVPPPTEEQPTVPQPTVEVTTEPTMTPSPTVTNELLGSINIAYWVCPNGVDPSVTNYDNLQANCMASANGIQFALSKGGQPLATQATGYYADGEIGFGEVPTGQITISQVPPPGVAAVICHGIVSHGGPETGDMQLPVFNGSVTWNLKDDEIAYCDWYAGGGTPVATMTATSSTTPQNELLGQINVEYWECPANVDPMAGSPTDLETNCTVHPNGIKFAISNASGPIATETTGDDADGAVDFGEVPIGPITISQIPAPASARVICHGIVSNGGPETGDMQLPVTNGAVVWNLIDEEIAFCNWYAGGVGAADTGFGTVYINKHACPASFDAYNADIYQMAANCHDNAGAVTFSLHYPDGVQQRPATTSNAGINDVTWTNVPAGKSSIWEDLPTGYGSPVVFCKVDLEDGTDVVPFAEIPTIDGRAIEWTLAGGQVLWCDWFNVPAGTGTVHILKHACPAGYDVATKTIYDFAVDCHDDAGAVEFKVNASGTIYTGTTSGTGINDVNLPNLPAGTVSITETLPSGYGTPVVFCKVDFEDGTDVVPFARIPVTNGTTIDWQLGVGHVLWCDWHNVPQTYGTITVIKHGCPAGYHATIPDLTELTTTCIDPMAGVTFTLSNLSGPIGSGVTAGDPSTVSFANVPAGPVTITETIPNGYGQPIVFCGGTVPNPPSSDIASTNLPVTAGAASWTMRANETVTCDWFNIPDSPGSITIYKWTCSPGYDYTKPGADPKTECTNATNGVNFTLVDTDPATVDLQTMTGDSIQGAVNFGGEKPGEYTVTETVPAGIASVFVFDCSGGTIGMVHPAPLATGNMLGISLGSGDQIVCNWYNVPAQDPNTGDLTIHVYICTTSTFVSDVQCETYEQGKQFTVQPGGLSGTTNNYGVLTFQGLTAGDYAIAEIDGQPCKIAAAQHDQNNTPVDALNPDGSVKLTVARETVVSVYNCTAAPTGGGKLPNSGKLPTKFPNTGMQDTQVIEPDTGTPPAGTPSVEPCAAVGTPTLATPDTGVSCGAVPVSVEIPAINVDAKVEVLETVNGEMQQPTGPDDVAWYKETPKLGAPGNIVMAGHLNYWGVPEGVFFNLATLQPGDRISITGADGDVVVYQVEWVKQADATKPPEADVLAETATPSLTLITCGGPWNAATSLYTERTVVRAVVVDPGT